MIWSDRKRTIFGLPLSFTKYSLDNEVLFIKTGFFTSKEDEVRLYRITDVTLSRTLMQKIFRVGTISCCSADKTLGDFKILSIKNPKEVKKKLSELVESQRDSKRVSSREYLSDSEDEVNGLN